MRSLARYAVVGTPSSSSWPGGNLSHAACSTSTSLARIDSFSASGGLRVSDSTLRFVPARRPL